MSSLKMTFSLASLVMLMALGLVFGTTSVMAHPHTDNVTTLDTDESTDAFQKHSMSDHPMGSIVLTSANADAFKDASIKGSEVRPVKEDGTGFAVLVDDAATEGTNEREVGIIKLIVRFSQNLTVGSDLVADKITLTAIGKTSPNVDTSNWTTTVARATDDAKTTAVNEGLRNFDVTVALPTTAYAELPITLFASVDEDAVESAVRINATTGESITTLMNPRSLPADAKFSIVASLTPPKPDAAAVGKLTGTASLTADFEVTVTFDIAVTDLTAGDFDVTSGSIVTGSVYADPKAAIANTVWKATVHPEANPTTPNVSVTLKTTATVKPVADDPATKTVDESTGGIVTVVRAALASIAASVGANDEASFVVTLTFTSEPSVAPVATDIDVTPKDVPATAATATTAATPLVKGAEKVGNVVEVLGSNGTQWQIEIKPASGKATIVDLTDSAKLTYGSSATALTVAVKGSAPAGAPTVIAKADATYDTTKEETTLKGMLAANGFVVVVAEDLQDIQRFFAEGGSISVLSSLTGAEAKSVVISEIMWGLNLRAIGAARSANQFVELYNTSGATIDLKDVKLTFDDANTPPAAPTGMVLLDQVSNVSGIGWVITAAPGSSGRIAVPDNVTTFVPSDIISMWRKIDYAKVEKADHDAADAVKNRAAQLDGFPNGNALGSWAASNASDTYGVNLIGSPGAKHFVAYGTLTATLVPYSPFVINEIGNNSTDAYDWVELRNVSTTKQNLKNRRLSQVTKKADGTGEDKALVTIEDKDHFVEPGQVALIVNSDPFQNPNHPLAAGIHMNGTRAETTGVISRYYVDSGLKLANSGQTLLILRGNNNDHLGKINGIIDLVGTLPITDNSATLRTALWPLVATVKPHDDVVEGDPPENFLNNVYKRAKANAGTLEHTIQVASHTGLGYKRGAGGNGTPGYPNGARIDTEAALTDGAIVTISEIMYAKNRSEPQWIELYNSSDTQAVNLNEWKLKIEQSRDADDIDIRAAVTTNNLGGNITIQPNQTVLIVSNTTGRTSRSSQGGIDFPASRIINLWAQKDKLEVASGKTRLTYRLLSETAFRLTLMDKGGAPVDVAGNLGADGTVMWELPMLDPEESEGRSSIIRRYDDGVPRDGTMVPPGDSTGAWVLAATSPLADIRFNETYYGSPDDVGTPGFRVGGPLPVSLSKFRPERLDSGEIVVRWITESELNNAGFNILRSDARNGEFTKLNTKLIAGQGTTSERTVYEFPDTSAKPNVVYYYQIQDVSLDGKVQTLRQSRIKGYVSPSGKLTTIWGELKALQ